MSRRSNETAFKASLYTLSYPQQHVNTPGFTPLDLLKATIINIFTTMYEITMLKQYDNVKGALHSNETTKNCHLKHDSK